MTAQRILQYRNNVAPGHILPDAEIGDVLNSLAFRNVGALVVGSDGKIVAGITAGRDIVRGPLRLNEGQAKAEALCNYAAGGA